MSTPTRLLTCSRSTCSGGRSRCPTQTTPQATACITEPGPPRISTAALLRLAQWCQSRRGHSLDPSLGGPPCPTPTAVQSPPAPKAHEAPQAADPSVVGPVHSQTSGSPEGAQPDHRQGSPSRGAEGGRT